MFIGATTALAELKDGLDQIWDVPPERMSGFWYFVRKRLLSVGLILSLGFLLLVSLVLQRGAERAGAHLGSGDATGVVLQGVNFLFSFALVTVLFAMIYKILPSVRIAWRDVIIGALDHRAAVQHRQVRDRPVSGQQRHRFSPMAPPAP